MKLGVNCVNPGPIDSPMHALLTAEQRARVTSSIPLGWMARPEEIANGVLFLASSRAASFMYGTNLFSDAPGRPWRNDALRRHVWAPLLRRAGVAYRKPHALRHTVASMLVAAREDLPYVARQLGHRCVTFTLRVYAPLAPRDGHRGVDALDHAMATLEAVPGLRSATPAQFPQPWPERAPSNLA